MADLTSNINSLSPYYDAFSTKNSAAQQALLGRQEAQTSDYLNRYKSAITGQETTSDMAKRIGTSLGLPALSQNAYNLNEALRRAPQVQATAARGNEITQNQLDRMTAAQINKLSPLAQEATRQKQEAENMLTTQMGYEQTDQAKELLPFTAEQTLLTDKLARETTMYTTTMQAELDALTAKIQAGVTLTEGEANRANALALKEKEFEIAKYQLANQPTKYASTQPGGTVFNTETGKYVTTGNVSDAGEF